MDAPRDIVMSTVCSSAPVLAGSVGLGGHVQPVDVDRAPGHTGLNLEFPVELSE